MYGPVNSPTMTAAMTIPSSSLGVMFEPIWMVFGAITVIFMAVSVWQLCRPNGDRPRP